MLRISSYLRLSKEDSERKDESQSISNQRYIIEDFIKTFFAAKKYIVKEYIDDGYSGADPSRPSYNRLLLDIQNKETDCIIVKDLSRLGRDFLEVFSLIKENLLLNQIRFIAINPRFDSEDKHLSDIDLAFSALMNQEQRLSISRNIKLAFKMRRKKER